jgi:hypothetical protein
MEQKTYVNEKGKHNKKEKRARQIKRTNECVLYGSVEANITKVNGPAHNQPLLSETDARATESFRQNLYTAFCGAYHRTAYTFYAWSVFWARPIVLFLMQTCSLSSFSFLLFLLCSNFLYFILDLNQLRIYSNFEISKFVKFLRFWNCLN